MTSPARVLPFSPSPSSSAASPISLKHRGDEKKKAAHTPPTRQQEGIKSIQKQREKQNESPAGKKKSAGETAEKRESPNRQFKRGRPPLFNSICSCEGIPRVTEEEFKILKIHASHGGAGSLHEIAEKLAFALLEL